MPRIPAIKTFEDLAAYRGQKYTRVKINDKTAACVLYNNETFDVYYLDNEAREVCGRMTHGDPNIIKRAVADFLMKFKKTKSSSIEGLDAILNWLKTI